MATDVTFNNVLIIVRYWDVVGSYRKYYILEKVRFAKWEKHGAVMPEWFKEGINAR